jgi:hypothetical protein
MRSSSSIDLPHALNDPHAVAERLAEWADSARRSGRALCADGLLLLAWEAYDRPTRGRASNDNLSGATERVPQAAASAGTLVHLVQQRH